MMNEDHPNRVRGRRNLYLPRVYFFTHIPTNVPSLDALDQCQKENPLF